MRKILIYFLLFKSFNIFSCCPENPDTKEPETVDADLGGQVIVAGDFENTKKFREVVKPEYNEYKNS